MGKEADNNEQAHGDRRNLIRLIPCVFQIGFCLESIGFGGDGGRVSPEHWSWNGCRNCVCVPDVAIESPLANERMT
jgi:hypothetical protein